MIVWPKGCEGMYSILQFVQMAILNHREVITAYILLLSY